MDKKFCSHCGKEVNPDAVVCVNCGCSLKPNRNASGSDSSDGMKVAIKIFMILGIVSVAWFIIPLIWCIPMYIKVNKYLEGEVELSTGYKVCVLLFCSMIAGILLLVDNND